MTNLNLARKFTYNEVALAIKLRDHPKATTDVRYAARALITHYERGGAVVTFDRDCRDTLVKFVKNEMTFRQNRYGK